MEEESEPEMGLDQELQAMSSISQVLQGLDDEDAQTRVVKWMASRYGVPIASRGSGIVQKTDLGMDEDANEMEQDVSSTFLAADPQSQADKALVVGYWFQEVKGVGYIESYRVNKELKNLGHGIGNITRAFDKLIDKRPQLAIQTYKSGAGKTARKRYKITQAGIQRVRSMMAGNAEA